MSAYLSIYYNDYNDTYTNSNSNDMNMKMINSIMGRSKESPLHKILCLRVKTRNGEKDGSCGLLVEVDLAGLVDCLSPTEMPPFLGWEKNERGKMGPRMVNLSANMDPTKSVEQIMPVYCFMSTVLWMRKNHESCYDMYST